MVRRDPRLRADLRVWGTAVVVVAAGALGVRAARPSASAAIDPDVGPSVEAPLDVPDAVAWSLAAPPRREAVARGEAAQAERLAVDPDPPSPTGPPTRWKFVDAITGRSVEPLRRVPVARLEGARPDERLVAVPLVVARPGAGAPSQAILDRSATAFEVPAPYFAHLDTTPGAISPRARAFEVHVPLHRELDVRLRPTFPNGRIADDVRVSEWSVDGVSAAHAILEVRPGTGRVLRRVPWIPGARLSVEFDSPPARAGSGGSLDDPMSDEPLEFPYPDDTTWEGTIGANSSETVTVGANVDPARPRCDLVIGHGGRGCGGGRARRSCAIDPSTLGGVRLRVTRRDGQPMAGVAVTVGPFTRRTDADGSLAVDGIPEGAHTIRVDEPGYRLPRTTVRVVANQRSDVELVEPEPASIDVRIVGADLRPVPSARLRVSVSTGVFADVSEAAVQRLDPFTDALGRRLVRNLPPGPVDVEATVGRRTASATIDLVEGGYRVLELVVR